MPHMQRRGKGADVSAEQLAAQKAAAGDKKRFVRLRVQGSSGIAVVRPDEVSDFCDGEEYIQEDVWMTESQYQALPEFEGY